MWGASLTTKGGKLAGTRGNNLRTADTGRCSTGLEFIRGAFVRRVIQYNGTKKDSDYIGSFHRIPVTDASREVTGRCEGSNVPGG